MKHTAHVQMFIICLLTKMITDRMAYDV
jgi:hypothetical protein